MLTGFQKREHIGLLCKIIVPFITNNGIVQTIIYQSCYNYRSWRTLLKFSYYQKMYFNLSLYRKFSQTMLVNLDREGGLF
jgi:hypothetical protein